MNVVLLDIIILHLNQNAQSTDVVDRDFDRKNRGFRSKKTESKQIEPTRNKSNLIETNRT